MRHDAHSPHRGALAARTGTALRRAFWRLKEAEHGIEHPSAATALPGAVRVTSSRKT